MTVDADPHLADYVSHEEFRAGLSRGRFRVIVDPKRARGYVVQRLWLLAVVIAMLGVGIALAVTGSTWSGALLVFAGVALNRTVARNAARILLHLATRDPSVYDFATQNGIMEVRRI